MEQKWTWQSMKVEHTHVILPVAKLRSRFPYLWTESRSKIEKESAFMPTEGMLFSVSALFSLIYYAAWGT